MKKGLKDITWIPFGISIGALVLYLKYYIQFKTNSNIVVTEAVKATLNQYLIVVFVALFVGLLFVLFDKIKGLKETDNISKMANNYNAITDKTKLSQDFINAIENNARVVENKTESNFMKYVKNNKVIKVKISDPVISKSIKGKIVDTDEEIEILLLDDDMIDLSLKQTIEDPAKCPKCGNILTKSAFMCTNCGVLLNNEILETMISNYKASIIKEEKVVVPYKKKFNVLRFIANFLVIILCIFLIFLIGNKIINERDINYRNINIVTEK